MWSQFVLCLFVGLAYASNSSPAWSNNKEYVYNVRGRTLTGLDEAHNQFSGIFLRAKLHITPRSDGKLQGRISNPKYAQIQSRMPSGWSSQVPESQLSFKPLSLSEKPFQLKEEQGVIKSLIVEKEVNNWEANIIKSIVSQLQIDLQGKNSIDSPINTFPNNQNPDGVFKTMEETVTGKTETLYQIHPYPKYLLQNQPWLAPLQNSKDEDVIEVIKNKNYTNAEERPVYQYGFGEIDEDEPSANKVAETFVRDSSSRVIITGTPSRYTIQHSATVNKNMVNPTFKNKEMGSVISYVNITLTEVNPQSEQPQDLADPIDIGDLVYTFAKQQQSKAHKKSQGDDKEDSSSEESPESTYRRFRRSASQRISKKDEDSSSSEEDSKEMQQQPRPQLSRAPESPLLPSMIGYHGKSIKENKDFDLEQNVEKLVQEISEEIQNPEKILKEATLNKYTILNTLVRLMDEKEIKSVAEQFYTQDKQGQEGLAWAVYRDAVAEAGTGPAFLNIKEWIQSKKCKHSEAAEMVNTMAQATRTPTEEYMRKFFDLVKDSEVEQQQYLNETAVLAFTSLAHTVYINRNASHNQFPVHAFGSFYTKEGREFIKSAVIPYLSEKLDEAVRDSDARAVHTYTIALGNIGHRNILQAFEPYLEGDKQCSQFQRMLMVASMEKLAEVNPTTARSVLYKVYQNQAETPEVRTAAVYQLFKADPSAEMLQRMAQNTINDYQEEVNAAVKSAIRSAAGLQSPKYQDLKRAAESAMYLLHKKEHGAAENYIRFSDYEAKEDGARFAQTLNLLTSQDSNWPKALGYCMEIESHGMKQGSYKLTAAVSSMNDLYNVMYQQTESYQKAKSQRSQQRPSDGQWSSANIAQKMKYQRDEREQLEGLLFAEMASLQSMFSFDNQTFEQLPEAVRKAEESLRNGKEIDYSKLKQLKEMALSFPTEMGLPFLYTYDMPMLVRFQGKVKASARPQISENKRLQSPDQISAKLTADLIISAKIQIHLAFVTPFDHQMYMAGFDKKMQVYMPINAKMEVDVKNQEAKIEIEMEEKPKKVHLMHYSSRPYTSRSDVMSTTPVALRPNTNTIKASHNHRTFDAEFGKKTSGLSFRVWGHHPSQSASLGELARTLQEEGLMAAKDKLWDQGYLENTEANIAYQPSESSARKITLHYSADQDYKRQPENQQEEDFLNMNELSRNLESNQPEQRQRKMMKHVGSGIQSASLSAAELSFENDQSQEYSLGYASAKSDADPKSRAIIYFQDKQRKKQSSMEAKGMIPNTNGLDLMESLKEEPSAKYQIRMQSGKSDSDAAKISGKVEMRRSEERKEYLTERAPMYQVCKSEMQEGNKQLAACQNMTISANYLDQIKFNVHYENIDKKVDGAAEAIYQALRVWYYPLTESDSAESEDENKVSGMIQFHPEDFSQVNVTLRTQDGEAKLVNLSLSNGALRTIAVPHPVFHLRSRIAGALQGWQNFRPSCVIDQNAAQTFSNWTYPMSLDDNEYTVVMQYIPEDARKSGEEEQSVEKQLQYQTENYVVLARRSGNQKEIIVSLNHPETKGRTVEIKMKPSQERQMSGSNPAATVTVDDQEQQFNDKEIADQHNGLIQIYALPNGEVKMEVRDTFYMIYDGKRAKITATSSTLRDSVTGLCGQFSEDKYEDFTVPENCVVGDAKQFVQSFRVSDGKQRRQRSGEWQEGCEAKVLPLHVNVISSRDSGRSDRQQSSRSSSRGMHMRPRYVEENGEICFTLHPVPTCSGSVRKSHSKNVAVHCVESSKTALYLKKQIDQGGKPDFSQKSESKKVSMDVPSQCA